MTVQYRSPWRQPPKTPVVPMSRVRPVAEVACEPIQEPATPSPEPEVSTEELIRSLGRRPSVAAIITIVARQHNISVEDIKKPTRKVKISRARQEAIYLLWKIRKDLSLKGTAKHFNVDHTSILHARRAHEARLNGTRYVKGAKS